MLAIKDEGVCIRAGTIKDLPFILNSWLTSYKKESYWGRVLRTSIFYDNHKLILASILDTAEVLVMHHADDQDNILGYIVFHPHNDSVNLHYIYVKTLYRGLGFARRLLREAIGEGKPLFCTHTTDSYPHFSRYKISYNPYYLFEIMKGSPQ